METNTVAETAKTGGGDARPNRGPNRGRRTRPEPEPTFDEQSGQKLAEKVVFINRSAKVVKGGRRFSFSALIVIGDKHGRVGVGLGKAREVAEAIRKGGDVARSQMVGVSLNNATIPHEVYSCYCGAKVLLRPASPGTGIIAGQAVRAVCEAAGIKNILTKSFGTTNPITIVKATFEALGRLRTKQETERLRGVSLS